MRNFKLEYNVPEDMLGNSKKIVAKYSDDQDIREPVIYGHYNGDILKIYINGNVELNKKYSNIIDKEKVKTVVDLIKGFKESLDENDTGFCAMKISLMFSYTNLIIRGIEYYENHKSDPKFIKRVEELKNERNSNNR